MGAPQSGMLIAVSSSVMRRSASLQIRCSRSGWRAHGATTYSEHPPGVQLFAGRLALASSLVEQVQAVADVTDNRTVPNAALAVAALRGCENDARQADHLRHEGTLLPAEKEWG